MYNIGSLAIGLSAWILGSVGIRVKKGKSYFQIASFTCCCGAMLLQFYELRYRCRIGDFSAVDDTISAICLCAGVLSAVTIFLNLLCQRSKGRDRHEPEC